MENIQAAPELKKRSKAPLIVTLSLLAALAAGYVGLCAYATQSKTIWHDTYLLGQEVGGLTVDQAAAKLESAFPGLTVGLYLYEEGGELPERQGAPDATVAVADLGATLDARGLATRAYQTTRGSFLRAGWDFLNSYRSTGSLFYHVGTVTVDAELAENAAADLAAELSRPPEDTGYDLGEDALLITAARDGRRVDAAELRDQLANVYWSTELALNIPYSVLPARTLTAQEISDQVSGEVKNAGYDPETGTIIPEQVGADFDVARAQQLMDAAEPGETVEVAAEVELPAVTAEMLAPVLFRDVLGTYTTHVGGTAARISNVKLAAAAINGTILNSGDVFDYNQVVGQRTAARGYQAAPAYVKGETVDEIGGGVCQPSSTLYLACLKANLQITERYAHRYVPAYIPKGMDATVSWGGPNYCFRNDTDYPIRVEAVYAKGYLTMTLVGTKTDDITVKMTNKVLSTTASQVVYEDDPTLPAGTEQVKTTPYTGYKVETYRNLYDGNGRLISSTFEATSDYKVRNKVILKGPEAAAPSTPTTPTAPDAPVAPTDPAGTESPSTPETPGGTAPEGGGTAPETPGAGAVPETPGGADGGTPSETPETGGAPIINPAPAE